RDRSLIGIRRWTQLALLVVALFCCESVQSETTYSLGEGFRSIKWGTQLLDAKKTYPDLLFVEQIPRVEPKYLYYRRKNEDKSFSGFEWNRIRYVFSKEKLFVAADAEKRMELHDKNEAT